MFSSLKNKIREETGSDFSKLTAKITSSTVQKIDSLRGRSHQGSTSSLNSIVSSEGVRDEGPIEPEEYKKRVNRIEAEFAKKLEQKEHEWQEILKDKDNRLRALEKEKNEAYKQIANLKESLMSAEGMLGLFVDYLSFFCTPLIEELKNHIRVFVLPEHTFFVVFSIGRQGNVLLK